MAQETQSAKESGVDLLKTQTYRVHHELVSLGFDELPAYEFEQHDMGRPSGGFVCTARLGDMVVRGAPAATKQFAKSNASVALLDFVLQLKRSGSLVEKSTRPTPRVVRPGFLVPEPVVQFGPGEVKEVKDLVRKVGIAYLRDALAFYESRSTYTDVYEATAPPTPPEPEAAAPSPPPGLDEAPPASSSVGESQPASPESDADRALPAIEEEDDSWVAPMSPDQTYSEELSKLLTKILRYDAKSLGLKPDASNYVAVSSLMDHLPRKFTVTNVMDVAELSLHRDGSHRFRIKYVEGGKPGGFYIRTAHQERFSLAMRRPQTAPPPVVQPRLVRTKTIDPNRCMYG